jgi:enoyl-CoA hydratase|tara:strand:+ start:1485 stop:2261 length:777 start_codon:yes stop_codon:yes gene_type:complete
LTVENKRVTLAPLDRVAVVTLRWQDGDGRIDNPIAFDIADVCAEVRQDDSVWVVVLTADGAEFCGGTDPAALRAAQTDAAAIETLRVADAIAAIEKPVVCAINGDAVDQGLEIALACDLRVASTGATLGMTQLERGSMPWDGGTQRLPRLIGRSRATEMLLTSRLVSADEAENIGLVNSVVGPSQLQDKAIELASVIASHGPIALRYVKEAVLNGLDLTVEQGLSLEADLSFLLQSTKDRSEGLSSFLARRKPEYSGE